MINNLWMMGIQGSSLILVILAARWVLSKGKYPSVWRYSLWMLVGFRLLCPVFIESSVSIQPDFRRLWAREQTVEEYIKEPEQWDAPEAMGPEHTGETELGSDGEEALVSAFGQGKTGVDWLSLLRWIYGIGIWVTAFVFSVQYVRLKKCVAGAVREEKDIWLEDEIWLSEQISSPFVTGVFRHRIYLPYGLPEEERDCILKHERMHIRHKDPAVRLLGVAAVCLHWWNPLVWYGFQKMCEDMEMTCDESVLKYAELETKKIYAEALLHTAIRQNSPQSALHFGESHTEQRVRNLFLKKKRSFFAYILWALFVVICTQLFVTVARETVQEKDRTALPDMSGYSIEQIPVPLTDAVLCDTAVLSDGEPLRIQLVMTEGEYFTEEYAGAGGGTFEENYRGVYELRVLERNGKKRSDIRLMDEFGEERFNFGGVFELETADYNQDGCVDFTVGTWGSSSMGVYYLYTLDEDGRVTPAYPEGIAQLGFSFSGKFEPMEGGGFWTYTYNNATGEYGRVPYEWDGIEYVRGAETVLENDGEIPAS